MVGAKGYDRNISMDNKSLRAKLVAPIAVDNPVGERVLDDPVFDFVESQMMKVGSLSYAEVRWQDVEISIISLMENKTKDIKLLAHLLRCFHHANTVEKFNLSIWVLVDFMQEYWEICFPAPGKSGLLPRRKFFSQILHRLDGALEKLINSYQPRTKQQNEDLANCKVAWIEITEKLSLKSDDFEALISKLDRWLSSEQPQGLPVLSCLPNATEDAASEVEHREKQSIDFDSGTEKSSKDSLKKVADYLMEFEFGHALSLRVRRFAVWSSIESPPDGNHKGETLLTPLPKERIVEYAEQFRRNPDMVLWRDVEQSLLVNPYWFDGQHLSAQIVMKQGKADWAEAILEETQRFLARLPELTMMSFKGGVPFVGEETQSWLQSTESNKTPILVNSWSEKRDEALSMANVAGLTAALTMLNECLATAKEPRDIFYWRMLIADLLADNELEAMAYEHYHSLYHSLLDVNVQDWEPSLANQLKQIVVTK